MVDLSADHPPIRMLRALTTYPTHPSTVLCPMRIDLRNYRHVDER
jgi:hypothetical protein